MADHLDDEPSADPSAGLAYGCPRRLPIRCAVLLAAGLLASALFQTPAAFAVTALFALATAYALGLWLVHVPTLSADDRGCTVLRPFLFRRTVVLWVEVRDVYTTPARRRTQAALHVRTEPARDVWIPDALLSVPLADAAAALEARWRAAVGDQA